LLNLAKVDAQELVGEDPNLSEETHIALRAAVRAKFGESLGAVKIG